MNLSVFKKYPIASFSAVGVLALGALIFLRSGVVDGLALQEEELESRVKVIKDNQRNASGLEADVEELEDQIALLAERIFDRDDVIKNSTFFYNFANSDGYSVSVNDVTQRQDVPEVFAKKGPKELKLHSAISYDLEVEGQFYDVVNFLQELNQTEAIVRVSGFDVSHANKGERGIDSPLSIRVQVLALAEKGDS